MTFISYAQNFEDVMLWRSLGHVSNGFYVDVGAAWPDTDSVTKAFYERGWQGVNIEPNPEHYAKLLECRPNDVNLDLALSDKPGSLLMNFISGTGLSTLDEKIASHHVSAGWGVEKKKVNVKTLASVWNSYIPIGQDVHYLKVDVEGLEGKVLLGNDWKRFRPWVVLVEATLPLSKNESYASWEGVLLSAEYQFAYADGLNRFYVANEHSELLSAFKYPPNVFDDFLLHTHLQTREFAEEERARALRLTDQLQRIYNSLSWRITAPLRWGDRKARFYLESVCIGKTKRRLKKLTLSCFRRIIAVIATHPRLRSKCVILIQRLGLYGMFRSLYMLSGNEPRKEKIPVELEHLTLNARSIYFKIIREVALRKKGCKT